MWDDIWSSYVTTRRFVFFLLRNAVFPAPFTSGRRMRGSAPHAAIEGPVLGVQGQ